MVSQKTTALQSLAAGAAAGGVESFVTYPTEYVKTRKQLLSSTSSTLHILKDAVSTHGPRVVYTGASAFCISNTAKSGVRFLIFDTVRNLLPVDGSTDKPLPVSTMLSGMAAGVAESVTVLTPGENIKTRLVEDRSGRRELRSASHALRVIVAQDGLPGIFRGVVPVTIKQSSNALVRFTSYSMLLDWVKPRLEKVRSGTMAPAVAGAGAGVITVYATMPFDVVKTRMQGRNDKRVGTFTAFRTIVQQSGVRGLWRGTTPRLVRLSISGALSFSIYENVVRLLPASGDRRNADALA